MGRLKTVPSLVVVGVALALAAGVYLALEGGRSPPGGGAAPGGSSVLPAPPATSAVERRSVPAVQTTPSAETEGGFATAAEVAVLRQEVEQLRGLVAQLSRHSRVTSTATDGAAAQPPPSDAQSLAQEAHREMQEMDATQSRFQREPADAAWSAQVSAKIEDALAGFAGAPAGARDLECRSRTCRVEIASPAAGAEDGADQMSLDKVLPLLAMQLAESLPNMTAYKVDDGHRGTRTVLYFSRD